MYSLSFSRRFWKFVHHGDPDFCWEWQGCLSRLGYGTFGNPGGSRLAHRIAWELTWGKIPHGLKVLHHCDNPRCCNPEHLSVDTQRKNIRDCVLKGRMHLGEASGNSKLTEAQVREIRVLDQGPGPARKRLAEKYGVSESAVAQIISGRCWSWLK